MNENENLVGRNRFEAWEDTVADAVAFAGRFPQEVRSAIVQTLLSSSSSPVATASEPARDEESGRVSLIDGQGGIAAVARHAGVDARSLGQFIQVAHDGTVTVRTRLGDSRADSQNAYSAVLAYVREKALGELDTPSGLVRAICEEHRCLDRNLTSNLGRRRWLVEDGVRGGNKSYRLSPTGEDAAKELIVSMCADG